MENQDALSCCPHGPQGGGSGQNSNGGNRAFRLQPSNPKLLREVPNENRDFSAKSKQISLNAVSLRPHSSGLSIAGSFALLSSVWTAKGLNVGVAPKSEFRAGSRRFSRTRNPKLKSGFLNEIISDLFECGLIETAFERPIEWWLIRHAAIRTGGTGARYRSHPEISKSVTSARFDSRSPEMKFGISRSIPNQARRGRSRKFRTVEI